MTDDNRPSSKIAIISGAMHAEALAQLLVSRLGPVVIGLDLASGSDMSMSFALDPRDRRQPLRPVREVSIHERMYLHGAPKPSSFTITERPLTKRQRRRLKGKQA